MEFPQPSHSYHTWLKAVDATAARDFIKGSTPSSILCANLQYALSHVETMARYGQSFSYRQQSNGNLVVPDKMTAIQSKRQLDDPIRFLRENGIVTDDDMLAELERHNGNAFSAYANLVVRHNARLEEEGLSQFESFPSSDLVGYATARNILRHSVVQQVQPPQAHTFLVVDVYKPGTVTDLSRLDARVEEITRAASGSPLKPGFLGLYPNEDYDGSKPVDGVYVERTISGDDTLGYRNREASFDSNTKRLNVDIL